MQKLVHDDTHDQHGEDDPPWNCLFGAAARKQRGLNAQQQAREERDEQSSECGNRKANPVGRLLNELKLRRHRLAKGR
jgi:hypothetical protein